MPFQINPLSGQLEIIHKKIVSTNSSLTLSDDTTNQILTGNLGYIEIVPASGGVLIDGANGHLALHDATLSSNITINISRTESVPSTRTLGLQCIMSNTSGVDGTATAVFARAVSASAGSSTAVGGDFEAGSSAGATVVGVRGTVVTGSAGYAGYFTSPALVTQANADAIFSSLATGSQPEISTSGHFVTTRTGSTKTYGIRVNPGLAVETGLLEMWQGTVLDETDLGRVARIVLDADTGNFTIQDRTTGSDFFSVAGASGNTLIAGTLGVTGTTTLDGVEIIDVTNAEALLVRKNADAGDIFVVDTNSSNPVVGIDLAATQNALLGIAGTPSYPFDVQSYQGKRFVGRFLATGNFTNVGGSWGGLILDVDNTRTGAGSTGVGLSINFDTTQTTGTLTSIQVNSTHPNATTGQVFGFNATISAAAQTSAGRVNGGFFNLTTSNACGVVGATYGLGRGSTATTSTPAAGDVTGVGFSYLSGDTSGQLYGIKMEFGATIPATRFSVYAPMDNCKYVTGTGADVELYYNGTDFLIDAQVVTAGSDVLFPRDDQALALGAGAGGDARIYYDGTDLKLDPKVIGSGLVKILGAADADLDIRCRQIVCDGDNAGVAATTSLTNGNPALGGGAAATLGTIGGSGPATATQNSWVKIYIGTTAAYIPVWT